MSDFDEATRKRLLGLFVAEAEESLAALLEQAGRFRDRDDPSALQEFKETAHSLKGAAAAVGLPELVWAIHRIEVLGPSVAPLQGRARADAADLLRKVLHVLEAVVGGVPRGLDAVQPELEQLRGLLAGVEVSAAPGATSTPAAGAPSPQKPREAGHGEAPIERLNVPAHEVDEALRLASSVARLAAAAHESSGGPDRVVNAQALELMLASTRLEEVLFNLRMLPASEALEGLEEEIAALADRLGKEVRLQVEAHQVRADRRTLHSARSLMRHLLRNAMDHGLEAPEERARAGKARTGTLTVRLTMADSSLRVEVVDDGAGFDVPAIRQRLEARADSPARLAALSDDEVLLEFAALGGSTRKSATDVSGRGVGLSAVVGQVRSRGGEIKLESRSGKGSTIGFTLPLDVYATDVLTVRCGSVVFGLPLAVIERTVCFADSHAMIQQGPRGAMMAIDERIVHLRPLGELIGRTLGAGDMRFAVVVRAGQREAAFTVDELGEVTRVVPQAVAPWIGPGRTVIGMARLPDGTPVQVLNAHRLLDDVRGVSQGTRGLTASSEGQAEGKRLNLLLAEDSLATREVLRVLLEKEGYHVRVAGDGHEAQARIAEQLPDVVVSDFNMPRCDGPTLTRALRANAATARLPVILLTSRDDEGSRSEGAAAGADAYLIKSDFNAVLLRQTLRRLGVED